MLVIKFSKLLSLFVLFGLLVPLPAYQQDQLVPFIQCGSDPDNIDPIQCTFDDLLAVPVRIFNFLLGMAALVLLVVIIWAGFRMMLFHVSEMPEAELANAKLTLQRGIFGFIIIAFSYLIVSLTLFLLGLYRAGAVGTILIRFGL